MKAYGLETAALLRDRLADLRAALHVDDLLAGHPRFLGPDEGTLAIDLGLRWTMTWVPNHRDDRVDEDGNADWIRVSRVRLVAIKRSQL